MNVLFLCPPVHVLTGGIKLIFRAAEALRSLGVDAAVFEEQGRKPAWFEADVPVVGQGVFRPDPSQVLVLPEDQPQLLKLFAAWPQKKVVYMQNHFYAPQGLGGAASFADYGVTDILCSSRTIGDYARRRFPGLRVHVAPCPIDRGLYAPREKKKNILCVPRKRPLEAAYIRDLFYAMNPTLRGWEWNLAENMREKDLAVAMGEASVFLSLSRLEGLGLTPLEAMASGCVVAGFTGIGGREYATPENGFWVPEDDGDAAVAALAQAIALAETPQESQARQAYTHACATTLNDYTFEGFVAAMQSFATALDVAAKV